MKELFIFVNKYDDYDAPYYYLTDNAKGCKKVAAFIDKKWYKAYENDEPFDYFEAFEKECKKRNIRLQYFKAKEIFEY